MKRSTDWQNSLMIYLSGVHSIPFQYGIHDCALFCAGAIEAMTGVDLAKGHRGYASRADGIRKMRKAGFDDHVAYFASHLPECHPLEAQAGDLAVLDDAAMGVVQGRGIYVLTDGLMTTVSLLQAKRAFRV
jgi:hypothetical protein